MSQSLNRMARKVHRWGAIIVLAPLGLVVVSGLLLQVKKQVPWVQPTTQQGSHHVPAVSWTDMLEIARSIPQAAVHDWNDIHRIDIQPKRGIAKLICRNRWELQIDIASGVVLSSTYRRSDLIESLHDGSFFGEWAKLSIFLTSGVILFFLWLTGAYLWILPIWVRARKRQRTIEPRSQRRTSVD